MFSFHYLKAKQETQPKQQKQNKKQTDNINTNNIKKKQSNNQTAKNENNLGLKGDFREVCFKVRSKHFKNGNGKQERKIQQTKNNNVFSKGVDEEKRKNKDGILNGKTKEKKKNTNKKKRRILKKGLLGEQKRIKL